MTSRQEREVETQRRFRQANERLRERVGGLAVQDRRIPFLCECSDAGCLEPVHLTRDEYARVRAGDGRFLIVSGHPTIEGEDVVEDKDGYAIVEKTFG